MVPGLRRKISTRFQLSMAHQLLYFETVTLTSVRTRRGLIYELAALCFEGVDAFITHVAV